MNYLQWSAAAQLRKEEQEKDQKERTLGSILSNQCHLHIAMKDVYVAECFKKLNATGFDTRDEVGAHQYHQLDVEIHANYPEKSIILATRLHLELKCCLSPSEGVRGAATIEFLLFGTGQEQCGT
jgi:hypothetical protein